MQRKLLKADEEYLVNPSPKWRKSIYNNRRVRLVSTQPYGKSRPYHPYDKGTLVKVVYLNETTGEPLDHYPKDSYVEMREIRGLWTEATAEQNAERKAKDAADAAYQQRIDSAEAEARALKVRAASAGVTVDAREASGYQHYPYTRSGRWHFELTGDELTKLLNRLEATAAGRPTSPSDRTAETPEESAAIVDQNLRAMGAGGLSDWPDPDARPTY
jgi:hypothetical protein